MVLAPLDLVSAHPWRRVTFTTYALSLSFFESVLLDALIRGGGRDPLILSDVQGVRVALSEQGARRVGKEYDVEPLAVHGGIFHPKISVLASDYDCHLLLGSGNLTFGGWGGNCEFIEHLHPSFAADAFADAADFFDDLATTNHVVHGIEGRCATVANELRVFIRGKRRNGDVRIFHSLDGSISQKMAQVAEDLGGAVRLVVAAPFWDSGSAIDELCNSLGLGEVFVHAHAAGNVEGHVGTNWPANAKATVHPILLDILNEDERRLHAKAFEIVCRRGRLVVSGSANATTAALGAIHNVEACVARIQRETTVGWAFSASSAPAVSDMPKEDTDDDTEILGVLRAVLQGERIIGRILTPRMSGTISIFRLTTEGPQQLGQTSLEPDATFSLFAPGLEVQSWSGGRLVLQVSDAGGRKAEGFVSVAAFGEITRRAGAMASRLFAVIAGAETPADVAAIMSWFYEDPHRLANALTTGSHGDTEAHDGNDTDSRTIAVSDLYSSHAALASVNAESEIAGSVNWQRFMESVISSFRERRGPFGGTSAGRRGEDEDEEESGASPDSGIPDPAVEKSLEIFERLFEILLSEANVSRHAITAFDLTHYICDRLRPDPGIAAKWLERLVNVLTRGASPSDRQGDVAAAVLVLLVCNFNPDYIRTARKRLLRLGFPICGPMPAVDRVQGYLLSAMQKTDLAVAWDAVQNIRTFSEQIRTYLSALETGLPSSEYGDLQEAAPEEWPVLKKALSSPDYRERIRVLDRWSEACPHCHRVLPTGQLGKLRSVGIAMAKNCCSRVILYSGE